MKRYCLIITACILLAECMVLDPSVRYFKIEDRNYEIKMDLRGQIKFEQTKGRIGIIDQRLLPKKDINDNIIIYFLHPKKIIIVNQKNKKHIKIAFYDFTKENEMVKHSLHKEVDWVEYIDDKKVLCFLEFNKLYYLDSNFLDTWTEGTACLGIPIDIGWGQVIVLGEKEIKILKEPEKSKIKGQYEYFRNESVENFSINSDELNKKKLYDWLNMIPTKEEEEDLDTIIKELVAKFCESWNISKDEIVKQDGPEWLKKFIQTPGRIEYILNISEEKIPALDKISKIKYLIDILEFFDKEEKRIKITDEATQTELTEAIKIIYIKMSNDIKDEITNNYNQEKDNLKINIREVIDNTEIKNKEDILFKYDENNIFIKLRREREDDVLATLYLYKDKDIFKGAIK